MLNKKIYSAQRSLENHNHLFSQITYTREHINKIIEQHQAEDLRIWTNVEKLLTVHIPSVVEFHNQNDKPVQIDILMYNTIKILNEKGYYTTNCCSGHPVGDLAGSPELLKTPITKENIKDWYKRYPDYIVSECVSSYPYIAFKENYFKNISIPKPFYWKDAPLGSYFGAGSINILIDNFERNFQETFTDPIKKQVMIFQEEIEDINNILEYWATELPPLI